MSAVPELPGGFSPRTVRRMAVAAAVSFAAAVVLSVFGRDLSRPPTAGPDTWSASLLGYRGVADLLASLGLGVASRETRAAVATGPQHPLILAEPDPERAADPTRRLQALAAEALRNAAPLVLVLPKWTGTPLAERPGWIGGVRLRPIPEALRPLAVLAGAESAAGLRLRRMPGGRRRCSWWGTEYDVELAPAQLLKETRPLVSLVACRGGVLIGALRLTNGRSLFVVSDPDLLNNQGLARGDHAALVLALLAYLGATGVVFDETIHGFERASGLFAELFRFPLALVLVQSLVLLAAVLWAGMVRFGKPLPAAAALPAGKEVLIDNTARLLAAGGHGADSLARYYRQTVRAVAARLHLPADASARDTAQRLQRIADRRHLDVSQAELERRLADVAGPGAPAGAAAEAARAIHRWRREMTDDHR